jgi:hypothetical protein
MKGKKKRARERTRKWKKRIRSWSSVKGEVKNERESIKEDGEGVASPPRGQG